MMPMTSSTDFPAILWFRDDLRLSDHAALHAAIETGAPVLPVFVLDDAAAGHWALGGASRWWLHHSLSALAESLRVRGNSLVLQRSDSLGIITELEQHQPDWNSLADKVARSNNKSEHAGRLRSA